MKSNVMPMLSMTILGFALVSCQKQETPLETREDVAEAQRAAADTYADNAGQIAGAAQDSSAQVQDVAADAMEGDANAAYRVAIAKAEADMMVAKETCDGLPVEQQTACAAAAESSFEAAQAQARSSKEADKAAADAMP